MRPDDTTAPPGGFAASIQWGDTEPALVAPATANEKNVLATPLVPVACWRIDNLRFAFNSSFLAPEVGAEFARLAQLRDENKLAGGASDIYPRMTVFGHADPVGDDAYNKTLSDRRASAVYAVLTRRDDLWESLYSSPLKGDEWGVRSIQTMLTGLGFDCGPADGVLGERTRTSVRDFQRANGLSVDGVVGPQTRKKLFLAYMDLLCGSFALDPKADFLAGTDPEGKGDYQGCGEFNPVLVFSKEDAEYFRSPANKDERDYKNQPNRRVLILLFRPGVRIAANRWPCPRAGEGVGGCRKRLWSDGEHRRANQEQQREFKETKDTFACRFYDRLNRRAPCDGGGTRGYKILVRLEVDPDDPVGVNDKFVLVDSTRTYFAEKTVQSDPFRTNTHLDLYFENIRPNLRYTLIVQSSGSRQPYTLFTDLSYAQLRDAFTEKGT